MRRAVAGCVRRGRRQEVEDRRAASAAGVLPAAPPPRRRRRCRAAPARPGCRWRPRGVPQASASRATVGVASSTDESTKRSAAPCSARHLLVGHEAQEAHGARRGRAPRACALSGGSTSPAARDEQHGVRALARARRAMASSSVAWSASGMQALDVEQQRRPPPGGACAAHAPSRSSAAQRAERVGHRRVDDGGRAAGARPAPARARAARGCRRSRGAPRG